MLIDYILERKKERLRQQKQLIEHRRTYNAEMIKYYESIERNAAKPQKQIKPITDNRNKLLNEIQIQTAIINHYEPIAEYYKERYKIQTTDRNKLKYHESIFLTEQKIRKAKAKIEQIESELSRIE